MNKYKIISILAIVLVITICISTLWYALTWLENQVNEMPPTIIGTTERERSFEQCRKLGGVPISSIWDNRLKRCEFPNN